MFQKPNSAKYAKKTLLEFARLKKKRNFALAFGNERINGGCSSVG